MNDKKWERLGLYGGLVGVAALIATFVLYGVPPDADAPAAEIAEWYADNDSRIQVATVLIALAIISLAWWFGSLWRHMRRAEGGEPRLSLIAALGLLLSGATAMVSTAIGSATAMRIDEIGDDTAGLGFAIGNSLIGMSSVGDVVLIAAVSVLAIRSGFLPQWLGYAGALIAAVNLVGALMAATDAAVITFFGLAGFLTWMAWIAAVSLVLIARKDTPADVLDLRGAGDAPADEPATAQG